MLLKKPTLFFSLLCFVITSYSQTSAQLPQEMIDSIEFKSLLFNQFMDGTVLLKSGKAEQALMNYNARHQSINFISNGKYYTLTGFEDIDTIYIQNKRFIPVGKKVYEVINAFDKLKALLVSYSTRFRPLTTTTDHNGTTKQSSNEVSNTLSDVYVDRNYKSNSVVELQKHHWIKIGQNLYKADTKAQIRKIFPKRSEEEIDNYIGTNNLNLNVDDNLIALIEFLSKGN